MLVSLSADSACTPACPRLESGWGRGTVVTNPSVMVNVGSGKPAWAQRRIMSSVPVPIRSIYSARYRDSASKGLPGTELCATRSLSRVNGRGSRPGFRTFCLTLLTRRG